MRKYNFDLKYDNILNNIEDNLRFQYNLLRNKVLLSGDPEVVETFYKEYHQEMEGKYQRNAKYSTFWHNVGAKNARVFFGVIKMINDTMVKLVTNGGIDVTVQLGEEEVEEKTKRLMEILELNNFKDRQWGKMEMFASGLGYCSTKYSKDLSIGNFPIIEVIQPERYEAITKRDFVIGHIYKRRATVEQVDYEIQEHYKKDEQGNPIIEYVLYRIGKTTERIDISGLKQETLEALNLTDLIVDGEVKTIYDDFSGLSEIPAFLINNTAYNSWFHNSPYGEADTQGLDTIEDALSEVLSQMIDEIRKAKIKVLISESLVPTNLENQKLGFDDYRMEYEIIKEDEKDAKNLITIVQGKINAEQYIRSASALIMYACNKAQLHPITMGITGVESIDSSQESQQEREKVSMRTRETKLTKWRATLEVMFKTLLQADDIINENEVQDYDITIDFGEFSNPTMENIIDIIQKGTLGNAFSIKEGQAMLFGEDKTDEQKELMYLQTKVEKNITITNEELERYERLIITETFPEEVQAQYLEQLEQRQEARRAGTIITE